MNQANTDQPNTVDVLNTLMAIHCRSFPQYLTYSRPYIPPGNDGVVDTLEQIVDDQNSLSNRIAAMIRDADQVPDTGEFPMEFTDMHDLAIDFLLRRGVDYQNDAIAAIGCCIDDLRLAPAAQAIAEEALGMAKGHLELFERLVGANDAG